MRFIKFIPCLLLLLSSTVAHAQTNPTIEIVISQTTASKDDRLQADVYIRDGVNINGADIGILVDETCLRMTNRTVGTYLPAEASEGGFSPFSELHDHDTRFSAALTDRTKLAKGDGIFYSVDLQVTCENGIAPLTVVFAELSAYKDPTAAQIEFNAYSITAGTINIVDTQLVVGTTQFPTPAINNPQNNPEAAPLPIIPIVLVGLTAVGIIVLVAAFIILRRRVLDDDAEE